MRTLTGWQRSLLDALAFVFAGVFLLSPLLRISSHILVPVFVGGVGVIVPLIYPLRRGAASSRFTVLDVATALASVICSAYFIASFERFSYRPGVLSTTDIAIASVAVILALEVARRAMGWWLPILALISLLYAHAGHLVPGELGHPGFGMRRLVGFAYSVEGIYGTVATVFTRIVFVFLILGAFLTASRTGDMFLNLSRAFVGRLSGGAGHTAIAASALMGSFVGSGAANVSMTGPITIPLMKRSGFSSRISGALEVIASSGGHILPPVMGSTIFVMVGLTGIPYRDIIIVSLIPGALYYISLFAHVAVYSSKNDLAPLERNEIPRARSVLKAQGHLLGPIALLVYLLVGGYNPPRAAMYAIGLLLVVSWIRPKDGLSPRKIYLALVSGAYSMIPIGAMAAAIGVLINAFVLPGLPLKFASFAMSTADGNIFILLAFAIIVSYIFGMGLSVVASYVIVAVIAVPVLVAGGVPMLVAHLVLVWFALDSIWTPPIAVGAYIAAPIAEADWSKIAWSSVAMGKALYIVPLMMVFSPIMDVSRPVSAISYAVVFSIGFIALAGAIQGHLRAPLHSVERWAVTILSGLMFWPTPASSLTGTAALAVLFGYRYLRIRKASDNADSPSESASTTRRSLG